MARQMIRVVMFGVLVATLAMSVLAYDVDITAEGSGSGSDEASASAQAYQNARGQLDLNCQHGTVEDVHTNSSSCSGDPEVTCYVDLGATCHMPDGTAAK